MEAETGTKPEPFLAEMDVQKGKGRIRVRIYPPPPNQSDDDPKRFTVRNLKGNEVKKLSLDEQAMAETLVFGKPEAQTAHRLELRERNGRKRIPSSSRRTSRSY